MTDVYVWAGVCLLLLAALITCLWLLILVARELVLRERELAALRWDTAELTEINRAPGLPDSPSDWQ